MSGDRQPILLTAETDTVLARAIDALGHFPEEQPWVLIGGIAVFIRLGSVTRPTADADTVARSQADLIQRLVDNETTTVISGGNIEMRVGDATIEIDVMELADEPLPGDPERRAFALARRAALSSAITEQIVVTNQDGSVVADAMIPVANPAALIALKTVSMVRRPHSNQGWSRGNIQPPPRRRGATSMTLSSYFRGNLSRPGQPGQTMLQMAQQTLRGVGRPGSCPAGLTLGTFVYVT